MSGSKKSIVDDELLDWVIREEGFIDKPTNIGDGKITLGSGLTDPKWHSLYKKRGNKWSEEDNRTAVREELEKRKKWAEDTVPNWDSLPEHSQKAMLSYKYNYNFTPTNSPLLFQAMNDGRFIDAMYQMDATSKNPKFKKGLEKRRKREQEWGIMDLLERPTRNPFDGYTEEFPDKLSVNNDMQGTEAIIPVPAAIPILSNNYVEATVSPDNRPSIDAIEAIKRLRTITQLNNSLDWNNQLEPTHFVPKGQIDYAAHSEGGSLKRKMWDDLSLTERSEMMRVAIENGITNLSDIKKKYNEFAKGGHIYDGATEGSQKMTRMDRERIWREKEKNIAKSIVKSNPSLPNLINAAGHYLNSVPMLMTPPSEVTGVIAKEPLLPNIKDAKLLSEIHNLTGKVKFVNKDYNVTRNLLKWLGNSEDVIPVKPLSKANIEDLAAIDNGRKYPGLRRLVQMFKQKGVDLSRIDVDDLDNLYELRKQVLLNTAPQRYTIANPEGMIGYGLEEFNKGQKIGNASVITDTSNDVHMQDIHNLTENLLASDPNKVRGIQRDMLNSAIAIAQSEGGDGVYTGEFLLSAPKQYSAIFEHPERKIVGRGFHTNDNMINTKGVGLFNQKDPVEASSVAELWENADKKPMTLFNAPVWKLTKQTKYTPTKSYVFDPTIIDEKGIMHTDWNISNIFKGLFPIAVGLSLDDIQKNKEINDRKTKK